MDTIKTIQRFIRKHFVVLLIMLVVLLSLTSGYFYKRSVALRNPEAVAQKEAEHLAKKVAKHAVVPADEVPTIATVSDPEALKNQDFFTEAKVGDKVLIYSKAKKAVLYDSVVDRIIAITILNVEEAQ